MIIIFGGNVLRKNHGQAGRYCLQCDRPTAHELVSEQVWFTLFFIPVIPITWRMYRTRCPLCGREAAEKATSRWTLGPRQNAARFWGWLFAVVAGLWLSLLTLAFVASQFSDDPARPPLDLGAFAAGALCFSAPLLTLAALFFTRAGKLRRQFDESPDDAEVESTWTPPTTKKCPRCAEYIKLDAVACRHCGQEYDVIQVQAAVREIASERQRRLARMAKQVLVDELQGKRTALLLLGWFCIATCLLFWLGPILLWKAKQLGEQLRALRDELEPAPG